MAINHFLRNGKDSLNKKDQKKCIFKLKQAKNALRSGFFTPFFSGRQLFAAAIGAFELWCEDEAAWIFNHGDDSAAQATRGEGFDHIFRHTIVTGHLNMALFGVATEHNDRDSTIGVLNFLS